MTSTHDPSRRLIAMWRASAFAVAILLNVPALRLVVSSIDGIH